MGRHARPAGRGGRIELRPLGKFYGPQQALRRIDLTIESGEFFSLLGASGCRKTFSVTDVVFVGSMTHIRVVVAERELQIVVANDGETRVPVPGSTVGIDIPPDAVRLLPC